MSQKKNSSMFNSSIKDISIIDLDIDVVILCGGLGTRLRPLISDIPKVLAKIGNTTFLDILLGNISLYGLKNIILCIGHLKDHIKRHFDNYNSYCYGNYNIIFSEEKKPLGTGGALKNAELLIDSDPFIVMNGDSICNIDFREFLSFHINKKAILSMVLARSAISTISTVSKDYGTVILDDSSMIISFDEKSIENNDAMINAGIYIMQKDIFSHMPDKKVFSLEYDLFPKLCNNRCYGFMTNNEVIDIGTPERYKIAINDNELNRLKDSIDSRFYQR